MINKTERLVQRMLCAPRKDVVAAIERWRQVVDMNDEATVSAMILAGWEAVDAPEGVAALPDGREVLRIDRHAYILPIETHRARLAEAMQSAKKIKTSPHHPKPGESLAAVLCPVCQSQMAKSPICPACTKGRAGYKILCICTECSHEVYL